MTEQDKSQLLDLLKSLVAIPSVNTGAHQTGIPEEKIAECIAAFLTRIGMDVDWLRTDAGRPNLLGRWPASKGKPVLMLSAHMDTVNVDGMTIDPFTPKVEDGKIFGRGTCDTKGSLALFLWILQKLGPRLDVDLRFLATCDEENGCAGSSWLVDQQLVQADRIIVGEPTRSEVAIAHRGSIVLEITTQGKSCHASVPDRGHNAIYDMADLIRALRNEWLPRLTGPSYPLLGTATAAVTMIDGGLRFNVVPDTCKITIDLRTLPNQSPDTLLPELRKILDQLQQTAGVTAQIYCQSYQPALYTAPDLPLVKNMLQACHAVAGRAEPIGLPYFADSSEFARLCPEVIVFGPGDIAQAHGPAEFLELDQLHRAAEILLQFLV